MSISDKLTRLASAREDIIDALADKGVTATGHGFEDFPNDIAAITGGGGSWTLLGAQDYEVNTTSTSAIVVGTISCGAGAWTSNKIIYVKVRDKAGARNGYFVGSDAFFYNYGAANGATSGLGKMTITIRRNNDGKYGTTPSSGNTGYGVYGFSVNTDGDVSIRSRYNNAYTYIINGTYRVEVYALDYAPDQGNPFNYSFN